MNEQTNLIYNLHRRLELLENKQQAFSKEIHALRSDIFALERAQGAKTRDAADEPMVNPVQTEALPVTHQEPEAPVSQTIANQSRSIPAKKSTPPELDSLFNRSNLEKFIGENLINKIGIAITVIGVAIGAKYSFDHELISPLMRIILGYLMGLGLMGVGFRLKKNYPNYSAVLVSGAIAILYFLTYFAYDLYQLIPLPVAFCIMVGFTIFAVVVALNYNQQIIALIGMVGAYAVPFLLSEDSGRVWILFGYMAILNVGILIIALRKYWKLLYYVSFAVTWIIFTGWYLTSYVEASHFGMSLSFLAVYFVIFYAIFLAHKLIKKEKFEALDVALLLSNSFIFYGIGYSILSNHPTGSNYLGVFTLFHAGIHAAVAGFVFPQKQADRNVFYLIAGLALVFFTIAIPVQLDGNWVTLLWAGEAALLFWIGRKRQIALYEGLSYPLMVLAMLSIYHDWAIRLAEFGDLKAMSGYLPLLNVHFLTGLLFVACFAVINYLKQQVPQKSQIPLIQGFEPVIRFAIPAMLLLVLYVTGLLEITGYFQRLYLESKIELAPNSQGYSHSVFNQDLNHFRNLWAILYSLVFTSLVTVFNVRRLQNPRLGTILLAITTFFLLFLFLQGFADLDKLRSTYLAPAQDARYPVTLFHLAIRYLTYLVAGLSLWAMYAAVKQEFQQRTNPRLLPVFEIVLFISSLWMLSSELLHWMNLWQYSKSDKLGLSILWGLFAMGAIAWGIWQGKRHIRLAAIVLFSFTLIKLFLYDISHLSTLAKTVVFVSLGLLLLVISFLYNKYKHLINDDHPEGTE